MKLPVGIRSIKTTIFGILLLVSATIYKFMPWVMPDVAYEPNTWLVVGLYLFSAVLVLFDAQEAEKALKMLLEKLANRLLK